MSFKFQFEKILINVYRDGFKDFFKMNSKIFRVGLEFFRGCFDNFV